MKCSIGCTKSQAVCVATLRGKPGTASEGSQKEYALCDWHLEQIRKGDWGSVELIGFEFVPTNS